MPKMTQMGAVSPAEAKRTETTKKADMGYIMKRLWKYLSKHKFIIAVCIVLVIVGNLLALWGPRLSGKAIETVGYYTSLMIVFYIISGVMNFILTVLLVKLSRNVTYEMRRDVFNRLTTLPVGFFDTRQTGDIISVISYDIDTVNASLSSDLLQIVKSLITVVVSFIMMLTIKPELVLIFVVTVPISMLFSRYITKKVRPLFRKRSRKLGEMNGYAEEMIDGQKITRAYNRENVVIAGFDVKNGEAIDAYNNAEVTATAMGPSVNFINNLSLTLVSVFGAILYINGGIGLDGISSFVLYSRKFSGPINETANIFGELQSAFAAAERVFRLIDEAPEPEDAPDAEVLTDVVGDVELKHVDFGYVPERTIIKDFSLTAPHGSLIAIVGPTGAGKTTIINLLMRFYDVNSGSITIDDKSIYGMTRESLRGAYTMVLQDTWLFSGSIMENIAYANENATKEDVIAAAKAAHIHNFIMRLPNGYDTILSDNGTSISKGQKQLMTIARAMLLDSHMLILDEATSNVDTRTEMIIQSAMRELMRNRTCFVIAHRLSTIRNADNILVVRDGSIVESGRHEELLERNGYYAELFYSQFEVY